MTGNASGIKEFYQSYHDRITDKRFNSPYWLRRYAHRQIYQQALDCLQPGQRVLDAGCGEGVLACLAALNGAHVKAVDISQPNVDQARQLASDWEVQVDVLQADAEHLPFADNSFDVVISSHVIEHLPHPQQGLQELRRVTRNVALVAMPTCLNPAVWTLLGGGNYWRLSKRSLIAAPLGLLRTVAALVRGDEGPQEGYAGRDELPHVWRFPWVMRRMIESIGFQVRRWEGGPLVIPYLAHYVPPFRPLQTSMDRWRSRPILRYLGLGSFAVCSKQ